jgi:outer membrane lipopolysaccharide assembly protein LptE/RlpB
VVETYHPLGVGTQGPVVACAASGWTCTYGLNPPTLAWEYSSTAFQTPGQVSSGVAYHLQEAVQVPTNYANLALSVSDATGRPVSYLTSSDVAARVQALHPAAAGYVWVGYQSTAAIDPGTGAGSTNTYVVRVSFSASNPSAVTGATWSSSDADVVAGIAVVESYHILGVATQGPVVACQAGGWTCTYGLTPPVMAWSYSSTAFQTPGQVSGAVAYHLQEAVQLPIGYAKLAVSVTDANGNPVSYLGSIEVTAKVQALHPAPAGYVWVGYQSTVGINPGTGLGSTNSYLVRATFSASNPGAVTGATWSSSDADVVSGLAVVETYHALGVGNQGPVVACRAGGWTCTYGLIPPTLAWSYLSTAFQTAGQVSSGVAYHLQEAVQVPTNYANLALLVTGANGQPVSYLTSSDVTAKVQALHPAAAGYVWVGYQSTVAIDPGNGAGNTNSYVVRATFSASNPGAVTGATWSSSDADVVADIAVVESYHGLGVATQGPVVACQAGGWTCTYGLIPPTLAWSYSSTAFQTLGQVSSGVAYHLQEAVEVPTGYAKLALSVTDANGQPVSYLASSDVTAKVQALHPAARGYVWVGYQSIVGIDPGTGEGNSNSYVVRVSFSASNPGAVTGATWSSSDADVVSGIAVVETYHPLAVATPGAVVACAASGWTCTYSLNPPTIAWDYSSTAVQSVGQVSSGAPYHLQEAVQVPTGYAKLALSVTDSNGQPVGYVASTAVTAKVQALHPAAPGYVWVGYQSTLGINPGTGVGNTNSYVVRVSFSVTNPGAVTGATWSSSDADVVAGIAVVESYHALGLPTLGGKSQVAIVQSSGAIQLSWTGPGTLQDSVAVTGPWIDSTNQSNPQIVQLIGPLKFFILRQ